MLSNSFRNNVWDDNISKALFIKVFITTVLDLWEHWVEIQEARVEIIDMTKTFSVEIKKVKVWACIFCLRRGWICGNLKWLK